MTITWYPPQLFVRRLEVFIPVVCAVVIAFVLCIWSGFAMYHVKPPVFLHYSVELGVDAAGAWWESFLLPGSLLIASVALCFLTNALLLQKRSYAVVVAYASLAIALFGAWCVYLILRANGAA